MISEADEISFDRWIFGFISLLVWPSKESWVDTQLAVNSDLEVCFKYVWSSGIWMMMMDEGCLVDGKPAWGKEYILVLVVV